ncbi:MAG: hypothetical protein MJZ25_08970 [Fibrobacter sp.]|nr:hypothetical protein [Fibrobacter sp.]
MGDKMNKQQMFFNTLDQIAKNTGTQQLCEAVKTAYTICEQASDTPSFTSDGFNTYNETQLYGPSKAVQDEFDAFVKNHNLTEEEIYYMVLPYVGKYYK